MDVTDRLIPTFAMVQDPRLRRLFALCGKALADCSFSDGITEMAIEDILLDVAPEFLPPDELGGPEDDSPIVDEWNAMIEAAIEETP